MKHSDRIEKEIRARKKRYAWWFDHPTDWAQPVQILYLFGWCAPRGAQQVRAIRATLAGGSFRQLRHPAA